MLFAARRLRFRRCHFRCQREIAAADAAPDDDDACRYAA